jgi:hypothetical protein
LSKLWRDFSASDGHGEVAHLNYDVLAVSAQYFCGMCGVVMEFYNIIDASDLARERCFIGTCTDKKCPLFGIRRQIPVAVIKSVRA